MKEELLQGTPLILSACIHASIAHRGQVRKGGDIPYCTHPLQVARILAEETHYPVTAEVIAAAILHDVIEDTDSNIDSFPESVQRIVHLVSDPKGEGGPDRAFAIFRIKNHPDAIMVKMADRFCNLNEQNEYRAGYHAKPDVRESSRLLITVAEEAGLDQTEVFRRLYEIVKSMG